MCKLHVLRWVTANGITRILSVPRSSTENQTGIFQISVSLSVKFVTWIEFYRILRPPTPLFFFVEYVAANFITFMGCFLQYVYCQHNISSYLNYAYACETIDNDLLEFVRQPVCKALWLQRHTAIEEHGLINYLVGVKFLKAKFDPKLGSEKCKDSYNTILCELASYPVTHGITPEAAEIQTA